MGLRTGTISGHLWLACIGGDGAGPGAPDQCCCRHQAGKAVLVTDRGVAVAKDRLRDSMALDHAVSAAVTATACAYDSVL